MSEYSPGKFDPTPEQEAWRSLRKIIAELKAASEKMGENKPLWDEELRRISARLEIFRHEPRYAKAINAETNLFVPANRQRESLYSSESTDGYDGRELIWRVVADIESDKQVLWGCTLVESAYKGATAVFEQCTLPAWEATPELVEEYLRGELKYPHDDLALLAPLYRAVVNATPGATVSAYYRQEELHPPAMPVDAMKQWFYWPE